MQLEENNVGIHMLLTQSRNQRSPCSVVCAGQTAASLPHVIIFQRSRMLRRARTDLCGGGS